MKGLASMPGAGFDLQVWVSLNVLGLGPGFNHTPQTCTHRHTAYYS